MGYSATSTFIICVIMSVVNQIGCLFSANHIFPFGIFNYLYKVVFPLLIFTLLLPLNPWIITNILSPSVFRLFMVLIIDALIAILLAFYCVLDNREKEILTYRYGLNNIQELTQKEIAKKLHISRSYVSRIEKRALIKMLREFIKNKNITE